MAGVHASPGPSQLCGQNTGCTVPRGQRNAQTWAGSSRRSPRQSQWALVREAAPCSVCADKSCSGLSCWDDKNLLERKALWRGLPGSGTKLRSGSRRLFADDAWLLGSKDLVGHSSQHVLPNCPAPWRTPWRTIELGRGGALGHQAQPSAESAEGGAQGHLQGRRSQRAWQPR